MTSNQGDTDTNLFTGVDLRAFWETLRLRWWIIPAVLTVSVGFFWAQASEIELRTEPEFYVVTQTYEARDPAAILVSAGIDPLSVREFPDATNQLQVLLNQNVQEAIIEVIGRPVNVSVSLSRPSFTLVGALESYGESSFVFQKVPTYVFACRDSDEAVCMRAIDVYVAKASEIRKSSFIAGLDDLKAILNSLNRQSQDQTIDTKLAAIELLTTRLDTPFVQIATRTEVDDGDTVSSVRRPTFVFSFIAGLIVSFLILLQLTMSDRRIRSARRVASEVGPSLFLGDISLNSEPSRDLLAAVSLQQSCVRASAKAIIYVPLSRSPEQAPLERLATMCGLPSSTTKPFPELSVPELVSRDSDDIAIVIAQRNHDLRQHLLTAVSTLRRSGQNFGGVLLLD